MKMNRMLSLCMAAALLVSMSLPALAAETPLEIPQRVISEEEILAAAQPQDAVPKDPQMVKDGNLPVSINAKAAVLMDASTKKVLMAYHEHEKLPPASVTKIMTLLLVMEALDAGKISLTDKVTASAAAAGKGGSQIWLKEGEVMTVDELLKATAVGSANDACVALAELLAGSEEVFVSMCNERASQLGMKDTYFENCTGLDDSAQNHVTSAYDIALMSAELIKHERIQNYTTIWMDSLRGGKTELVNTNKMVRFFKGTTGLKTGTTSKAGHCLSATAKRDGTHLIAVVLGSDTGALRFEAAKAMLNWGFANWAVVTPKVDASAIADVTILHGLQNTVKPVVPAAQPVLIPKGKEAGITQKVELAANVEAPVEKGQVLGSVTLMLGEEELGKFNLTAAEAVGRLTFGQAFLRLLRSLAA